MLRKNDREKNVATKEEGATGGVSFLRFVTMALVDNFILTPLVDTKILFLKPPLKSSRKSLGLPRDPPFFFFRSWSFWTWQCLARWFESGSSKHKTEQYQTDPIWALNALVSKAHLPARLQKHEHKCTISMQL